MKKIVLLIICMFVFSSALSGDEYIFDAYGEITLREKVVLPDGSEKVILKTQSYWVDTLGDYGEVYCVGGYDKIKNEVNLKLICEGVNQNEEKFWGSTDRTSAMEAGTGKFEYISGTGKYKELIGLQCNFAVRYFRNTKSFYKHKCDKKN